jgi:tRNA threonylcarbamoyladenosine biosynthesis protein TsaB
LLILALDTATLVSSVALATADRLVAELTLQTKKTHSELLMTHIAQIIEMSGTTKEDLTAIAVSIGPGSFTGLRIGLSTAKALAYALQIPVIGVPTLAALAYACPFPGAMLAPMMDAQKGNIYEALFSWQDGDLREIRPARIVALAPALAELAGMERPVVALGEGAVMYSEQIAKQAGSLVTAPPHIVMPRAGSVAMLGQKLLQDGVQHNVMSLEPLYIRRAEAEELWERRHGTCV